MEIYLGQKAKHKDLYHNEVFEIVGIRKDEVELKGDFSGGTHNVEQVSWMPRKGLMPRTQFGHFIDKEKDIDFTKGAGQRD